MSKEMINSKIKAQTLSYVIQNDTKYIVVADQKEHKQTVIVEKKQPSEVLTPKTTVGMVISLYQKENSQLKEKIKQLETKIDTLIDDKLQMLKDERDKIEAIYSDKDEQLKNVLELINAKMHQDRLEQDIHDVEPYEVPSLENEQQKLVELKKYLKTLDITSQQRKNIKERFLKAYNEDIRVIKQNGRLYLDFSKYDYSDLLEY
jgi:small-conductance mechanosensitive channel